ncbi:MAG: LLM class flavin-dependent oxidoreductase [Crocinitomicaceae bacterium]
MKFGIFDHMDFDQDVPVTQVFQERLELLKTLDHSPFSSYLLAEHHGTRLGASPSPNLFLSAASQVTNKIHLGAMVYCLPLYHPVRLVEEIGMLANLLDGRIEIGIGRGGSPYELGYFGVPIFESKEIFSGFYEHLKQALLSKEVPALKNDYHKIPAYENVVHHTSLTKANFWYGASTPSSVEWVAHEGMNMICGGSHERIRQCIETYNSVADLDALGYQPNYGSVKKMVIADSMEEALAIAEPAYRKWYENMSLLWNKFGTSPANFPEDLQSAMAKDKVLVGTPETVAKDIHRFEQETGSNLLLTAIAFGTLSIDEIKRTVYLFENETLPIYSELKSLQNA